MAAGTLANEIIAREINAAKGKVQRAEVEVSAIVDTILAEAATAVLAAMRNHESEAGRLRLLLIGAPLSGEMVLIAHDDLHAPSIRAGERAGHGPDPQRWADFRKALVADADASFLELEKSGMARPKGTPKPVDARQVRLTEQLKPSAKSWPRAGAIRLWRSLRSR